MMRFLRFLILALILLVSRNWFLSPSSISFGDAGFYFLEQIKEFAFVPFLWSSGSLGGTTLVLNSFFYLKLPLVFLSVFDLPWWLIERLCWYFPFLFLTFFSAFFLLKKLEIKKPFDILGAGFYLLNSYILMIIGGGQISIALSYGLLPFSLLSFIKAVEVPNAKFIVLTGLVFALQFSFEPRFFLLVLIISFFYYLVNFKFEIKRLLKSLTLPLFLAGLIHFFWILPLLLIRKQPFEPALVKTDWLSFLSLSQFSNSLSLLHPNWPENIFGKTYFFNPLFLILPLVAFSSLLFIDLKKKQETKKVIFFILLGLLGAFLAKGVNPPFGFVYRFFYDHLPFFNTFRDPVKFYFLTALSFLFLIPFCLQKLRKISFVPVIVFVFLLLLSIKPAWTGQLDGTFKVRQIPQQYLELKEFLISDESFSRTLWLPKRQRFGFYSNNHPAIDSENFFGPNYCLADVCQNEVALPGDWGKDCPVNDRCYVREMSFLLQPETEDLLKKMAVGYLIVPLDPFGEIFIDTYKYNPQQRQEVEQFIDQINWLEKVTVTDGLAVYKVNGAEDHFYFDGESEATVSWRQINPTSYEVSLGNVTKPATLVFSETFDPLWQVRVNGQTISSSPYNQILNSFAIDTAEDLEVTVVYQPQKYLYWGGIVSLLTLLASVGILFFGFWRKNCGKGRKNK